MEASELIANIRNTRDYENLKDRLGKELGGLLYRTVGEFEKFDKELDLVHGCLTELYNASDENAKFISRVLDEIQKLKQ